MSEDLEERLRKEAVYLAKPSSDATAQARRAVLVAGRTLRQSEQPARVARRRSPRWAAIGVAAAFALSAAFGSGYTVATSRSASSPGKSALTDAGPGFLPAEGWDTLHTGLTESGQAPAAIAATVPIAPEDMSQGAGNLPRATIDRLPTDEILMYAIFYPRGEIAAVDATFPRRKPPLALADATKGSIEGDPRPEHASYRLLAGINGWNVDLIVFTGANTATEKIKSRAEEELARLVVPQRTSP